MISEKPDLFCYLGGYTPFTQALGEWTAGVIRNLRKGCCYIRIHWGVQNPGSQWVNRLSFMMGIRF